MESMGRRAVMAAWVLTAGLALATTAGCKGLNLRGRDDRRPSSQEEVERIQEISERAQAAIDRGDYDNAQVDLVRLVDEEPESAEALQRLGSVLMLQRRSAEAEACFHAALARDHDYVEAMLGLGQVEADRGDTTTALKRFELAISIDPHRPRAHYLLGRAREAVGQTAEALAAYFRALEFDANDAQSIIRIAAIQLGRNQPDQALSRLDQAVELSPDDGEARSLRGLAHWRLHHLPRPSPTSAPPRSCCPAGQMSTITSPSCSRPTTSGSKLAPPPNMPSAWPPPTPPSASYPNGSAADPLARLSTNGVRWLRAGVRHRHAGCVSIH
jgi:tetratricopeptide (TPR) repeat protein